MAGNSTPSRAERIAQLIVLDMILTPGVLFVVATVLTAWAMRDRPLAWLPFALATALSLAVATVQWPAMWRAVRRTPSSGAGIPRPDRPGRGVTTPTDRDPDAR
jgi:membrane protein implicated in regulation of membrane protease activity